jgi:hypothetical protein
LLEGISKEKRKKKKEKREVEETASNCAKI